MVKKRKSAAKAAKKKSAKRTSRPTQRTKPLAPSAKTPARRAASAAALGGCLNPFEAEDAVQEAIPGGPHDSNLTLEDAGLITTGQRAVFRTNVVGNVDRRGCMIAAGDVPNGAADVIGDIRDKVQEQSRKKGA